MMTCCPITHYPFKKVILGIVVAFLLVFGLDFVVHGIILENSYQETMHLWRPEEEMKNMMIWMWVTQLFYAKVFTILFALIYRQNCKVSCGFLIGMGLSLLVLPSYIVQYLVTPLPCSIATIWCISAIVQGGVIGFVLSFIFKDGAMKSDCK